MGEQSCMSNQDNLNNLHANLAEGAYNRPKIFPSKNNNFKENYIDYG